MSYNLSKEDLQNDTGLMEAITGVYQRYSRKSKYSKLATEDADHAAATTTDKHDHATNISRKTQRKLIFTQRVTGLHESKTNENFPLPNQMHENDYNAHQMSYQCPSPRRLPTSNDLAPKNTANSQHPKDQNYAKPPSWLETDSPRFSGRGKSDLTSQRSSSTFTSPQKESAGTINASETVCIQIDPQETQKTSLRSSRSSLQNLAQNMLSYFWPGGKRDLASGADPTTSSDLLADGRVRPSYLDKTCTPYSSPVKLDSKSGLSDGADNDIAEREEDYVHRDVLEKIKNLEEELKYLQFQKTKLADQPAQTSEEVESRLIPKWARQLDQLFIDIQNNNVSAVKDMIFTFCRPSVVNLRNDKNWTPLLLASQYGHSEIVAALLKTGYCKLELANQANETSLYRACAAGHLDVVELLMKHGASLKAENKDGRTPFFVACLNGKTDVCKYLLRNHPDEIDSDHKDKTMKTSLALAAYEGRPSIVALLLQAQANPNLVDKFGWSPLMMAGFAGHLSICQMLLNAGAYPHLKSKKGKSATMLAKEKEHHHIVTLIEKYY